MMVSLHPLNATKIRLIESAMQCFAAHGFEGTSIREIAVGAQANASLVSYYFGGKAGLYQETMAYIFQRKVSRLMALLSVLPVGVAVPRLEVIQGLKDYIRVLVETLMSCSPSNPLDMAAMTLMAREAESPSPVFEPMLKDFMRPFTTYMDGCLKALRPDLVEDARFAMALSIQGQVIHLRNALGSLRLLRENPAYPEDLPALIQHFIDFSLRGLSLPEALDNRDRP